jgi:hypothetical protein
MTPISNHTKATVPMIPLPRIVTSIVDEKKFSRGREVTH